MEDVFEESGTSNRLKGQLDFCPVGAMSINHDPSTEFEKLAARALGKGGRAEAVDNGIYRRAHADSPAQGVA
ncbi:MAG: hypothetical protein R3C12_21645 [Planctomycetaceae bacterium]